MKEKLATKLKEFPWYLEDYYKMEIKNLVEDLNATNEHLNLRLNAKPPVTPFSKEQEQNAKEFLKFSPLMIRKLEKILKKVEQK